MPNPKKIITVVGARPQFIKAGALSRKLAEIPEFQEILVHTGQHFDDNMSDIFFQEMSIPKPAYHFSAHGLPHGAMTGKMLADVESVLVQERPDYVLVYGDTNSTLAGALAAKKMHIPVIHVEAGYRSRDLRMPEEINRILTDRISNYLFCPTEETVDNLKQEGYESFGVVINKCGDVMYDAALFYSGRAAETSRILEQQGLTKGDYVLCTLHRPENTDHPERMTQILQALNDIHDRCPVIVPLHPRTQKILPSIPVRPRFKIIDPVGYFDILQLAQHCRLVLSDSGGLQKEAYFFQKYCISPRDRTEVKELHDLGVIRVTDANYRKTVEVFEELHHKPFTADPGLFGDGDACDKICQTLLSHP